MLGFGCPWKGTCRNKADGFTKNNYCNNDAGWRKCPYRPLNDGDRKVQNDYRNAKTTHGQIKFGQILVVAFIIFAVVCIVMNWR